MKMVLGDPIGIGLLVSALASEAGDRSSSLIPFLRMLSAKTQKRRWLCYRFACL